MFPSAHSKQDTANDALKILLQKTADPCEVLQQNWWKKRSLIVGKAEFNFPGQPHTRWPLSDEEISLTERKNPPLDASFINKWSNCHRLRPRGSPF